MIRLLIVDDHPIILDGSEKIFQDCDDIIVKTCAHSDQFHEIIMNESFDVFLIDVQLGMHTSGLELAKKAKELFPDGIVILYTGNNIQDYYDLIIEKKIDNVLSKTANAEQILQTIYASINKSILLPIDFLDFITYNSSGTSHKKTLRLNYREIKILQLVAEGLTNQEIALELDVTRRTIERNLANIYALLNVNNRTEVVTRAKELQLI